VLYREGLLLGINESDPIVRRRIVQKMGFILDDQIALADPGDEVLAEWMHDPSHAVRYRRAETFTIEHRYFRDSGRATDPNDLGEPFAHGAVLKARTAQQLDGLFGGEIAARVPTLSLDEWSDPLASEYGLHRVRVTQRAPGGNPALSEVRPRVLGDWRHAARQTVLDDAIQSLRARYQIVETTR
jgi:hypothetical protein